MPLEQIPYRFTVLLPASRDRAFRWATAYEPNDPELMGERGHRKIERLANRTLLLTDVFDTPNGRVTKTKLVHLLPDRYTWTNTHLAGPSRYSQFLYELKPAGRNRCRLRFTGLQVDRVRRRSTPARVARRAKQLAREDSQAWRRLARAMARELRS